MKKLLDKEQRRKMKPIVDIVAHKKLLGEESEMITRQTQLPLHTIETQQEIGKSM